jgi:mannonate dehydratase
MHPGEAAGLGIDIDESLATEFPYRRASLPIARLQDGTVHDW